MGQLCLKNFADNTPRQWPGEVFTLTTCQRHLAVALRSFSGSFDFPAAPAMRGARPGQVAEECQGEGAYRYLLEVICGIQSCVLAENEITRQFKQAYWQYLQRSERQSKLVRILEKLLQDAKGIRSRYLRGVGQKTYGAITRRLLLQTSNPQAILIMGAGQLAEDMIKQFKKRVAQIFVSARNADKARELCRLQGALPMAWGQFARYREFPFIVNTIGVADLTLFDSAFFRHWQALHPTRLFVDLGQPSVIQTSLGVGEGVIRLDSILQQSAIREQEKWQKIHCAQSAIEQVARKRAMHLLKPSELALV